MNEERQASAFNTNHSHELSLESDHDPDAGTQVVNESKAQGLRFLPLSPPHLLPRFDAGPYR